MATEENRLVLECGSGTTRVGWAGFDSPSGVFPTVVGHAVTGNSNQESKSDVFVGDDARGRALLNLKFPIQHGMIADDDSFETLCSHAFSQLKESNTFPVLLSETPLNTKSNREKTTEIMFESFNVPALYINLESELALMACGRTHGTVVCSGDGVTSVTPMINGSTQPAHISRMELWGV